MVAIHSLLPIAMDMLQHMGPQVDTVVLPVAMDPLQVAMVQPAQPMGQPIMRSAQIMEYTGRLVPQCMVQILPPIKSRITVDTREVDMDTPPTVVVVAMAR